MINKVYKSGNYFPRASSIVWWLKSIKNSFLLLIRSIKLGHPVRLIKYRIINLLTFSLVFPPIRLILGSKKAYNLCDSFEGAFCPSGIISLPPPFKSRIIIPNHISCYMPYLEIYLADVYRRETIKEGMNVIDVGANIGVYTVLATEKVGKNGKVVAIEPEPKNYKQLLGNIKLNNFQNVIPIEAALTDHNGIEKLYCSPWAGCHSLVITKDRIPSVEVSVKTLDKLVEELNLKKIDLIKIDTEGAEIPVLKGAERMLKANPNMRILVAAEHYPSEAREVCQFLNNRGFKTKASPDDVVITILKR